MRKLFAVGVIGVIILEIALVYFIMPLPGNQRMRSIDVAYLVYGWRDSVVAGAESYALSGLGASGELTPLNVSQEFWHSWRTFQPTTERY